VVDLKGARWGNWPGEIIIEGKLMTIEQLIALAGPGLYAISLFAIVATMVLWSEWKKERAAREADSERRRAERHDECEEQNLFKQEMLGRYEKILSDNIMSLQTHAAAFNALRENNDIVAALKEIIK